MIGIVAITVIFSCSMFMWLSAGTRKAHREQDLWAVISELAHFGLIVWIAVKVLT